MDKNITPLKALEILDENLYRNTASNDYLEKCRNVIFKFLRALEIIKKKEVNIYIFMRCFDLAAYNDMAEENQKLTQQDYDLLKEVLL